jgi:hypothetical protein
MGRARTLWTSQCDVAPTIRERYGLKAALDYLISEKLLNFAEAAASRPDFAQELPLFVAQVRRLFTPEEIRAHLAVLIPSLRGAAKAESEASEDEFEGLSSEDLAARLERLRLLQQLLEVEQLGTS